MNFRRIAVAIFFTVNGFLFANFASRLPQIQELYGLDKQAIGFQLLMQALGALIAMPFTGWLITNRGSRQIVTIAAISVCVFVPLIGLMPNVWMLGLAFFAAGLSAGMLDVSMNAQAVLVEQLAKKPIMASLHALFSAGMMLGAGAGSLFTRMDTPLSVHLPMVAALGLVFVLWAIRHLYDDQVVPSAKPAAAFRLPERGLILLGLIAFCCMLGEGAMANWSTNYMLEIAGSEPWLAPGGLAAFSLAMMLARFTGDRFRHSLGDHQVLVVNSLIAVAGLVLVLLFAFPATVMLGFLLVGLGLSLIVPIVYSTAGNTPGLAPGVGIGMVTTIGYAGFLVGPPVIGFLADNQGLRIAMLFTLGLFVLMLLISLQSRSKRRAAQKG